MQCHTVVKKDSPAIQKLAQYAQERKAVPWVRIYKTKVFVRYCHRVHLNAKVACADCHGPVAESVKVVKEGDISMAACMTCHQMRRREFRCNFCHERPQ